MDALDRLPSVTPQIIDLARRHREYGVRDAQYASVGAALLWTLEQAYGAAFTPEVSAAWVRAYTALSQTMITAPRLPERPAPTWTVGRGQQAVPGSPPNRSQPPEQPSAIRGDHTKHHRTHGVS